LAAFTDAKVPAKSATVRIILPDGRVVIQVFDATEPVQDLYDFVWCQNHLPGNVLKTGALFDWLGKRVIQLAGADLSDQKEMSFEEAGLSRASVHVRKA
jgi:L-fucose mutarotase/ribose pyranase (RbsD/FucU family)